MKKITTLIFIAILLFACNEDNEPQTELNPPTIIILSPIDDSTFDIGDEITFQANVNDIEDTESQLEISISSDIQGNLTTNLPITNNSIVYTTSNLVEGMHVITVSVTDSDNMQSTDEVTINISDLPEPVILNPITLQNGELLLNWTVSNESGFESYSIMRSENEQGSYEVIETISDINITNYTDGGIEFAVNYFYKIGTNLLNSTDVPESNIESGIYETTNIDLGTSIERLKIDSTRPYIYALDRNNGYLLIINKETLSVENSIFVGSLPADLDISLDNSKLYIALSGTNKIAVVNLNTQEKINDLIIDVVAPGQGFFDTPNRVICMANEKLVIADNDQHSNILLVDANNGDILWSGFSFYYLSFVTSIDKMSVVVSESNSTGVQAFRYNLEPNGLLSPTNVDNTGSNIDWYSNYGTYFTPISGNGEFIFYCGRKLSFNNLSVTIGSFTDKIHASNQDGTIAIGSNHIWDATNFSIIETLPFVNSGKMVFDTDSEGVYIYDDISTLYYFEVN